MDSNNYNQHTTNTYQLNPPYHPTTPYCPKDDGGFLWGLVGVGFPIQGIILFLIWRVIKPQTAKALGIGSIIGVALYALCIIGYYATIIIATILMAVMNS